jgi:hypothetical protein
MIRLGYGRWCDGQWWWCAGGRVGSGSTIGEAMRRALAGAVS